MQHPASRFIFVLHPASQCHFCPPSRLPPPTTIFDLFDFLTCLPPPIVLMMGIPTSQTFFPSPPASHTCFSATSRLLVIILIRPPTSRYEVDLPHPRQISPRLPPPSPIFSQHPASQMHCPPPSFVLISVVNYIKFGLFVYSLGFIVHFA